MTDLLFVSYEQAVLLKKLGFPQDLKNCVYYNENGELIGGNISFWKYSNKLDTFFIAPTLELVSNWLRTEKKIHIRISLSSSCWYYSQLYDCCSAFMIDNTESGIYKTYDEALIIGIDKALIILNNKL